MAYMQSRVAELEQYTRLNDVIVTGLRIKPRSYTRAVTADNGGEPSVAEAHWILIAGCLIISIAEWHQSESI